MDVSEDHACARCTHTHRAMVGATPETSFPRTPLVHTKVPHDMLVCLRSGIFRLQPSSKREVLARVASEHNLGPPALGRAPGGQCHACKRLTEQPGAASKCLAERQNPRRLIGVRDKCTHTHTAAARVILMCDVNTQRLSMRLWMPFSVPRHSNSAFIAHPYTLLAHACHARDLTAQPQIHADRLAVALHRTAPRTGLRLCSRCLLSHMYIDEKA